MTVNSETRFCPECGADWRASQIPVEYVLSDHYGHEPPCKREFKYPGAPTCSELAALDALAAIDEVLA